MKWVAASMRRSAVSQRSRAVAMSPASAATPASRVEGKDFDIRVVVESGPVEDRDETSFGARFPIGRVHRGEQGLAERPARHPRRTGATAAAASSPRPSALPRPPTPAGHARGEPGRAPPAERRRSPRPCRSPVRGWQHRRGSHRPGIAPARDWTVGTPRSAGSRGVATSPRARPRWVTASSKRCWMRASSPSTASTRTCSHGSSTVAASAGRDRQRRRCAPRRRLRSRLGRRRASSRPDPTVGPAPRRGRRCDRSARIACMKSPSCDTT